MTRLLPLPLTLIVSLGCAAPAAVAPPRALDLPAAPPRDEPRPYVVAELSPGAAVPRPDVAACADPRCGEAGEVTRVVLPHPRAAVVDLLDRYVRALNARAPDDLRPLFEEVVGTTNGAAPRESAAHAREQVVAAHAQLLDQMDRRGFGALALRVVSYDECRAGRCGALLRPGDWYVEWRPTSFRISPVPTAVAPTRMIIRFTDGVARIAALNDEFFLRRMP
ncbi:MAG: hypothetical protein U0324_18690 [Polyangiales bacterium]